MKLKFIYAPLLFLLIFNSTGFSEGTLELWPDQTQVTRILIAKGNVPGEGRRDPFACYNEAAEYRLYIRIEDPSVEDIYFGLGARNGTIVAANGWRIHKPDGTVIFASSTPTAGQGFITDYPHAIAGPSIIDPVNGYNANVVDLDYTFPSGDYYMTFEIANSTSRTFDYFDITVIKSTSPITHEAKPGRVFSKCWQIRNPSFGVFPNVQYYVFKGLMYIYSADGIVTRLNPNGFEGRDFSFSANESGCYPIGPLWNAQQARQSQPGPLPHNYPQFKIFLNNPDQDIYSDGIIGHLVEGSVTTETFCSSGTVNFTFQTLPINAVGTIEITLELSTLVPTLTDRILITNNVPGNFYTITWDGLDGAGVQVPSGSTFPFTLRYTNGLTNMPLWDVEFNVNGFIVTLVRPLQLPPLPPLDDPAFYWDDTKSGVGGGQMITPPGCTTPAFPKCHDWDNSWGDVKTINTWWYLVSNSTTPVSLTYKKNPSLLTVLNPVSQVCPGNTYTFTAIPDQFSSSYRWVWDGGNQTQTTLNPTIDITFPANATPGASVVTVNGVNAACGDGPITSIPITILQIPDLSTAPQQSVCSGIVKSILLTSNFTGVNYLWSIAASDCSPEITSGCPPPGTYNSNPITIIPGVSGLTSGTITFHVTPSIGTCAPATPIPIVLTVSPLPDLSTTPGPNSGVCDGQPSGILLLSTFPSTLFSWSAPACSNILTPPGPGNGNSITNTYQLAANLLPGAVNYSVTPTNNGCVGIPVTHTVTVNQLPDVQLPAFSPACLNSPPILLDPNTPSPPGGTYTLDGIPITIFTPSIVGTYPIIYTVTDANNCTSSDQKDIVVQDLITPNLFGETDACLGVAKTFSTDPGMVATSYQWTSPNSVILPGANPWEVSITWPTTTGNQTFSVTYTDPNNCTTLPATKSVFVHPLPTPTIDATGNFNVCLTKTYIYTTQPGKFNYAWSVSTGNMLTFNEYSATVTWNTLGGGNWIGVNYDDVNGCTAVNPTQVPVMVNPSPVYSVTGAASVCAGSLSTYNLQGTEKGNWTMLAGGSFTSPTSNVNSVTVRWTAANILSQSSIIVNYTNALGCDGVTVTAVDIQPLPVISFTSSTPSPVCQDFPTPSLYTIDAGGPAASYQWQVTPAAYASIADPLANPASIIWKLPGNAVQTAVLTLSAMTTATTPVCTLSSGPTIITINPKPNTQLLSCFDPVTFPTARPFNLHGGTPSGISGIYSGAGVTPAGGLFEFNPALVAGPFPKDVTITYEYTNIYSCPASDTKTISIVNPPPFQCGDPVNNLKDVRTPLPYKFYGTYWKGNRCWMTQNLDYGMESDPAQPQTDNCQPQKYCLDAASEGCAFGGFYQWDELMRYGTAEGSQGICPPGWHVPSTQEWQALIDEVAGMPAGQGTAGDFLEPPYKFDALTNGIYYMNNTWAFNTDTPTGTMFWTSTLSGNKPVARGINNINPSVSLYESAKQNAFPVRCVKD